MMKIKNQVKCELARRELYEYCRTLYPKFYKKKRTYLKYLCNELQEFYYNDVEFMVVNAPPRMGKSFSATNFAEWIFGINPAEKIMSGSYNEDLSKNFSKKIRNTITTDKLGEDNIVYSDIFPNTKIKFGSAEAKRWQTEASNEINYLATSPTGTATGFGATCFTGETIVKTINGNMKIEDIFKLKSIRVLSYDHKNGIIRYNDIKATRRKISNDLIKITTETGREIISTSDHRYYIEGRGYIEGYKIREGDTFKTLKEEQNLCSMWKRKRWKSISLQRVLRY